MSTQGDASIREALQCLRDAQRGQAERILGELLRSEPANPHALHLMGAIALQSGRHAEAAGLIRSAIAISPGIAAYHGNLGVALRALGRRDEAIAAYRHALALEPGNAEFHSNLGRALREAGADGEAIAHLDRAVALRPAYFEAQFNLGNALRDQGQLERALTCYGLALAVKGDHRDALVNRGMTRLLLGDYAGGWDGYEQRNDPGGAAGSGGTWPAQWHGEPLAGKSILLRAEQGFGDTLQFVRYVPLVAARGGKVMLEVQPELHRLLERVAGADQVIARGAARPETDRQCRLPSLPWAFATRLETIPDAVPYLVPQPALVEHWRRRLGPPGARRRVGLAWAGRPTHVNDSNRSLRLAQLRGLAGLPDVDLIALQKGEAAGEAGEAPELGLTVLGDELGDFADTAGVIANLDLVISVDTSIAHLAGAMGKPVWVMLPYVPDWRWLWQRDDSPWYPTARLFRQPRPGDWASVIERVAGELQGPTRGQARSAHEVSDSVAAKLRQAFDLQQRGQPDAAERLYRDVLAQAPENFDALHMLGVIEIGRARNDAALELIRRAIALDPRQAAAHSNLAVALIELKRPDEALASCERALTLNPDYPQALNNRGNALRDLERHEEALASYERALALKPDYAEALNNRGTVLLALQQPAAALAACERALALKPDYPEALNNRGNALRELKQCDEALASFDRALALRPGFAAALGNRGHALRDLARLEDALASYERALALKPDDHDAHHDRGVALLELGRTGDALAGFARAIRLAPDHAGANFSQSQCRLLLGDLDQGWRQFEWRWSTRQAREFRREFAQPLWLGEQDVRGKTVLLHAEQGLGDALQFCRYARLVADKGATVLLEVQPALKSLLASLEGPSRLLARGEPLPEFDLHCPLLSLPLAFDTRLDTIPSTVPYLRANAARVGAWREKLGEKTRPRVGLAWSGGTAHLNDRNRSIPLGPFTQLMSGEAEFFSLQKDLRDTDRPALDARTDIAHFALQDFADTAALIELMDLVITVDTAVAHLAGAMGKPVWILLPFNPDWRWLLQREDSPWYPSARLFRQPRPGDWGSVTDRVKKELARLPAGARG